MIGEVLDFGGLQIAQVSRTEIKKVEFTLRDIRYVLFTHELNMLLLFFNLFCLYVLSVISDLNAALLENMLRFCPKMSNNQPLEIFA